MTRVDQPWQAVGLIFKCTATEAFRWIVRFHPRHVVDESLKVCKRCHLLTLRRWKWGEVHLHKARKHIASGYLNHNNVTSCSLGTSALWVCFLLQFTRTGWRGLHDGATVNDVKRMPCVDAAWQMERARRWSSPPTGAFSCSLAVAKGKWYAVTGPLDVFLKFVFGDSN